MPEAILMSTNHRLRHCPGHFYRKENPEISNFSGESLDGIVTIELSEEILNQDLPFNEVLDALSDITPSAE